MQECGFLTCCQGGFELGWQQLWETKSLEVVSSSNYFQLATVLAIFVSEIPVIHLHIFFLDSN